MESNIWTMCGGFLLTLGMALVSAPNFFHCEEEETRREFMFDRPHRYEEKAFVSIHTVITSKVDTPLVRHLHAPVTLPSPNGRENIIQ